MANNSLNDLSSVHNPDKSLHVSSEISPPLIDNQQHIAKSKIWEERFAFFSKTLENEIALWSTKNAPADCFRYQDRKAELEKFSDEFSSLFNDLTCEWVSGSGILTNGAGFDLFKAVDELYACLSKKYSFKLEEAIEVARLEYGYAIDDEDFEPGGY